MPTNADRFLDAFKAIEDQLRRTVGETKRVEFVDLVALAAQENAAVRDVADQLRRYARLRNAIVHNANDKRRRAIAEPRKDVVEDIEWIRLVVTKPPLLVSVLGAKVAVCLPTDPIRRAAQKMADGDFSQLPVYSDGQVIDLLTSEAIARWMTQQLTAGSPIDGETPVAEVVGADPGVCSDAVEVAWTIPHSRALLPSPFRAAACTPRRRLPESPGACRPPSRGACGRS
jgi:CBS domain-containing protein